MNRYKIVSLVLAVALLAALARLVVGFEQTAPAAGGNAVYENILARKSVRSYTDRPVGRPQLDTLLHAAMAAPSGRDMRPWKFVVVDRRDVLDTLHAHLPKAAMLAEAQAAIVVCGDLTVKDDQGQPSRNWPLDCAAATQNLLLAATDKGIGSLWICDIYFAYPELSAWLGEEGQLVAAVALGYPEESPAPRPRKPLEDILRWRR